MKLIKVYYTDYVFYSKVDCCMSSKISIFLKNFKEIRFKEIKNILFFSRNKIFFEEILIVFVIDIILG